MDNTSKNNKVMELKMKRNSGIGLDAEGLSEGELSPPTVRPLLPSGTTVVESSLMARPDLASACWFG